MILPPPDSSTSLLFLIFDLESPVFFIFSLVFTNHRPLSLYGHLQCLSTTFVNLNKISHIFAPALSFVRSPDFSEKVTLFRVNYDQNLSKYTDVQVLYGFMLIDMETANSPLKDLSQN